MDKFLTRYGLQSEAPTTMCNESNQSIHNKSSNTSNMSNTSIEPNQTRNRYRMGFNPLFCIDGSKCSKKCYNLITSNSNNINNPNDLYLFLKENDCLQCLQ